MKKALKISILLTSLIILGGILNKENSSQNDKETLAIYVGESETDVIPSKENYIFESAVCTVNGKTDETVKVLWDEEAWTPILYNLKDHSTKCTLYFKERYQEEILNGADPVLQNDLIPVTIDNDGTVKKADLGSKWYSYTDKEWANAVLLLDNTVYYEPGETIPEEAIESYFVWIPKYRYQLWDLGEYNGLTTIDTTKVHEIPIIFGDYNTSDSVDGECTTPMESGATRNCEIGDYMTHPAFLSIPSTGFWVGKFETGYNGATSSSEALKNENDASKVIIKPNTYSWRGIQVANAFYTSYNYKRELDSHMLKNTEWGAVAYLQHSAYGSSTNIRLNNNSSYLTGYQANNEPTCGITGTNIECNKHCNDESCNTPYPNSNLASTTGNITGIFDMSGGDWEYIMAAIVNQSGELVSGRNSLYNSGFNGPFGCPTCDNDNSGITELTTGVTWPDKKYYDVYQYGNSPYDGIRRILGDATSEMGPFNRTQYVEEYMPVISSWYEDSFYMIIVSEPWTIRGGNVSYGANSGIFSFENNYGAVANYSFRLVLTPV